MLEGFRVEGTRRVLLLSRCQCPMVHSGLPQPVSPSLGRGYLVTPWAQPALAANPTPSLPWSYSPSGQRPPSSPQHSKLSSTEAGPWSRQHGDWPKMYPSEAPPGSPSEGLLAPPTNIPHADSQLEGALAPGGPAQQPMPPPSRAFSLPGPPPIPPLWPPPRSPCARCLWGAGSPQVQSRWLARGILGVPLRHQPQRGKEEG